MYPNLNPHVLQPQENSAIKKTENETSKMIKMEVWGRVLVNNKYSTNHKILPISHPSMPLQTSEFIASRWGPKTRRMFASAEVIGIHQQPLSFNVRRQMMSDIFLNHLHQIVVRKLHIFKMLLLLNRLEK